MRSSTPVFLLAAAATLLLTSGCSTSALCKPAKKLFSKQGMPLVPLYEKDNGTCKALGHKKLTKGKERALFSDAECTAENAVAFAGETFKSFCKNNLLGDDRTRNYIGNPDAWSDIEAGATPKETLWTLSQDTTLHLAVVNQTRERHRPYLKKVEYRQADGCALGMHVYKSDPNAQDLKAAMFIHGGGWKYRGISAVAGIGASVPNITDRGYVVFAPFYRLIGTADGPAACHGFAGKDILDDIDAALDWVLENGEDFGVKWDGEKKVSLMGQSAGGHLSAYLATYRPDQIERGLLMYPAPDLRFFAAGIKERGLYYEKFDQSQRLLLGFFPQEGVEKAIDLNINDPQIKRNAFPTYIHEHPAQDYPPLDMVHGDADTTVPVELTTRLCEALDGQSPSPDKYEGTETVHWTCGEVAGAPRDLTIVHGANHALDLRCIAGPRTELHSTMDKLRKDSAKLCPAGSREGARQVRTALDAAYAKFGELTTNP